MKKTKIPKKTWFNMILFGLMGQLAWNVENMYFNTFLYNSVYSNGASQAAIDGSIPVMSAISIMVALSAATAVITTFVMGTLSDRLHNRKLFISIGYILWGIVTAAFGLISRDHIAAIFNLSDEVKILSMTVWTVIIMDCVMTFMGSTSNDSCFNAWVTDITAPENRPLVETIFAALPVIAMGMVVGVGTLAQSGVIGYDIFFLALGGFVIFCGVIGLFTLEEPKHKIEQSNANYWSDLFYGFRPSVIKDNSRLYLALVSSCVYSVAVQVFFPYMLIYLQYVVLPTAGEGGLLTAPIIICAVVAVAAIVAGILGFLKAGNKNKTYALIPSTVCFIIGLTVLGFAHDIKFVLLGAAPTVIGYAVLMIMFNASIRDFTPETKAGQFQGIRMIFMVLIPMVVGPWLGNFASTSTAVQYTDEYGVTQNAPTSSMFLCAAIVAIFVILPLAFLIKKGFKVEKEEEAEVVA